MNTKKVIASVQAILASANEILGELSEETTATTPEVDLDNLDSMKLPDLKKIADDAGIEYAKNVKKNDLVDAIREFFGDEEADEESEEEDEDEEGDEEQSLEDMSDEELIELAEENEVEVPYTGKGKKKQLDRDALIEALSELEDGEDEDGDDEDEDEDGEDEQDLEEMSDEELVELAEELEVEPVYSGKGKKKKLDREATIEAIEEAQGEDDEDEDGDDDEDESEEDGLSLYDEEDLDELDEDELKAHLEELAEQADEYEFEMAKGWKKLSGKAKLKKAILAVYEQLDDEE